MSITNTIIINMRTEFKNADEAYNYFLDKIITDGKDFCNTKAFFNVGFTLENPLENYIFNKERKWKHHYAEDVSFRGLGQPEPLDNSEFVTIRQSLLSHSPDDYQRQKH